jgi:hypothetical protein
LTSFKIRYSIGIEKEVLLSPQSRGEEALLFIFPQEVRWNEGTKRPAMETRKQTDAETFSLTHQIRFFGRGVQAQEQSKEG